MKQLIAAASFALFVLLWTAATALTPNADVFLPGPLAVAQSLRDLFLNRGFAFDILDSSYRVIAGFLLAMAVGYPIGLAIGTSRTWEAWINPLNEFARYLPVAALIPLVIIWFGIDDLQKVVIIFLGTVFQFVPMVASSVHRVPANLIELGRTMGFDSGQRVRRVVMPATAPEVYDHARICLGWAWSYLIVAEVVAANTGIGHVIIQAQRFIQTADVMAGIVTIGLIGLVSDSLFRAPKRYFFPWSRA
ncbi:ABC transporter permease [Sphingomonas sp. G-3-2-10]|uniref:ABC transporter permease n=1 Tax=Sphingomonas sp. G-3-2-10 TaxID=2728838 RepID=UPI00146E3A9F|nr:ABC transporter permease [Sphingomonas sp. G-3-2-10]NML08345.1 ABC transporter permease [Sphingomonas sp. G-3-2-10]